MSSHRAQQALLLGIFCTVYVQGVVCVCGGVFSVIIDHLVNNAAEKSHCTAFPHENKFSLCCCLSLGSLSRPQGIVTNHFICPHRPSLSLFAKPIQRLQGEKRFHSKRWNILFCSMQIAAYCQSQQHRQNGHISVHHLYAFEITKARVISSGLTLQLFSFSV